jgi:hypothetical protein
VTNISHPQRILPRGWRATALAAACATFLAFSLPASATATTHYGPAGNRFVAAFPSKPRFLANTSDLRQGFTSNSKVYAYWVSASPGNGIFAPTAPTPKAPTEIVMIGVLPTTAAATAYMNLLRKVPEFVAVVSHGRKGYMYLGSEDFPLNKGSKLTNPTATEGWLVTRRGATVVFVMAFAAHSSAAAAFISSFNFA